MVDSGTTAKRERLREYPTNVALTHEQREYLQRRAAHETAQRTVGQRSVSMSDILRRAIDQLREREPVEEL